MNTCINIKSRLLSQAAGKQGGIQEEMADSEEKQIEVEGLLIKASSQKLKDLAKVLKLEEVELVDKSKLTVLKLIRKHIGDNPTAETLEEVSTLLRKDPPALEGMEEEKQQKMKALKKSNRRLRKNAGKILKK